jgi:exodeoxyribonuclease V alpha subunit
MSIERAIDHTLARWVRERSRSELLARAAFAASRDEGLGHVCTALGEEGFDADALTALRAHAWVGTGVRFTPFVLDAVDNFYLWRNWRHETRVADALRARAAARTSPLTDAQREVGITALFAGSDALATHQQRVAVAAAPGARIFVLTGGPGTGKTTTVLRLLLMVLRHVRDCALPEQPAIALAAPTGKAAQRLGEAIGAGKQQLRSRLPEASGFRPLFDQVPDAQAQTLHRLLGFRPHDSSFEFGPQKPLAADIVVVDEASMIDIALMRRLLEALRPDAMLILLGDPGQLYAIEAGSVLSDIAGSVAEDALPPAASAQNRAPLAGQIVTLTHVWRAGAELQAGLDALRRGDAGRLDAFCAVGGDALRLCASEDAPALRERVQAWIDAHASYAELMRPDIAPQRALQCLREAQILCALREGKFGAAGINALVSRLLAEHAGFDLDSDWFHGRPVIITRNDYARALYNGDVGVALQGEDGLRVWFNSGVGLRSFSPRTLPVHETAWAITIHRSQGSEYGDVAVVLPPDADSRILSRELLYTAVSRATQSAEIWTSAAALRAAATRSVQRRGGLRARLAGVQVTSALR